MRVSLLSNVDSTSGLNGSGAPRTTVAQASVFRQSASGTEPAFWVAGGGTEYRRTGTRELLSDTFGWFVSRDRVLVRFQVTMLLEVPAVSPVASSAALEDRKNSVPLAALEKSRVVGDCAGQIVKPLRPLSAPVVSNWVTSTLASPRASAFLENAKTCALLNSGPKNEYSFSVR